MATETLGEKTGSAWFRILLVSGIWACAALLLFVALSADDASGGDAAADASFGTLDVERINIRDPDGTIRLAITNRAQAPGAVVRGKTYERSIDDLVGLIFYESSGDEAGGVVLAKLRDRKQSAFIFDYTHQITDGIGLVKRESEDGESWEAGLFLSDRRPYEPGDITSSQGVERIWLANRDGDAALEISDPEGRPRIRIGVDADGEPRIVILDEDGEVVSGLEIPRPE